MYDVSITSVARISLTGPTGYGKYLGELERSLGSVIPVEMLDYSQVVGVVQFQSYTAGWGALMD